MFKYFWFEFFGIYAVNEINHGWRWTRDKQTPARHNQGCVWRGHKVKQGKSWRLSMNLSAPVCVCIQLLVGTFFSLSTDSCYIQWNLYVLAVCIWRRWEVKLKRRLWIVSLLCYLPVPEKKKVVSFAHQDKHTCSPPSKLSLANIYLFTVTS